MNARGLGVDGRAFTCVRMHGLRSMQSADCLGRFTNQASGIDGDLRPAWDLRGSVSILKHFCYNRRKCGGESGPVAGLDFKSSGIYRKVGSVGSIPMHLRHLWFQ